MTNALQFGFETGLATDVGCRREINEDSLLARPDLGLWVVADGMGGHAAGDFASQTIVRYLDTVGCAVSPEDLVARTMERLHRANDVIRARSAELGGSTIGATVAIVLAHGPAFSCIWAGDSRVYLHRAGQLVQQTRDHTEVNALLATGTISETEAENWPRKNVITRAVGVDDTVKCDQIQGQLQSGDVLLLCSDGLTEHMKDHEIAQCLAALPPQQACDELIRETLARGAKDNVTVVALRCTQAPIGEVDALDEDVLDDLA
ncbi:PP2C family protein-serine/threonine phosphatase [Tritonibacter mobilis]|uniref:PP2C family protein-serine/threonine phosphatase n=1 Tax=Tritonibacter mobilis TaxID=379347 RepID=UPI001C08598B|nr:protein phosphatase 2C domain-containing protein [Tritonibacter mobilis]MBU3034288.1 protein phosphatase 2C domain-containing protein [Tritonibacter mobilis]WHQ81694.1 protein phosphatase 2C domain-containing protein [Tritonibacter mobilis]